MAKYRIVTYGKKFAIQYKVLGLFWAYNGEYDVEQFETVADAESRINYWRQQEKPVHVEVVKEL